MTLQYSRYYEGYRKEEGPIDEDRPVPAVVSKDYVTSVSWRPLERWLKAQAGRDWDSVYSDVCRKYRKPKVLFLRWAATWLVEQSKYSGFSLENGILQYTDTGYKYKRKPRVNPNEKRIGNLLYQKIGNCWFVFEMRPIGCYGMNFCHVQKRYVYAKHMRYTPHADEYGGSKRQLSSKEVRDLELGK